MSPASSAPTASALSIYVEPLATDARVAVLGDASGGFHETLFELGARTVHVFDPDPARVARLSDEVPRGVSVRILRDDLEVRDGAFDLVVVPDLGVLPDPSSLIVRLRRVLDARGTVVAMGRARTDGSPLLRSAADDVFPDLAPATLDYPELYDAFALQFESVTMHGVLPFSGVVFAELGAGDDLAVSVDTRLADPDPPGVFVVVAGRDASPLDPYAIVQIPSPDPADASYDGATHEHPLPATPRRPGEAPTAGASAEAQAAYAAMQLKAELLESQLDEARRRLATHDARGDEVRTEQLVLEREVAMTRAAELEGVLGAAQQTLGALERRIMLAEQGMLERDDTIAALHAELAIRDDRDDRDDRDRRDARDASHSDDVAELLARAEHAEATLALQVADLAVVVEAHAIETARNEAQLRERATVVHAMERELVRREQMVRELVASLEDAREGAAAHAFEAAPPPQVAPEELTRLRRKLDEMAMEMARREGELVARGWRIAELERQLVSSASVPPSSPSSAAPGPDRVELDRLRDELDALRQALTQEHAARVAAESGEELARARAELARQSTLLEQMRGRGLQGGPG